MAKNPPKAPADSADAPTTDANAPAPSPDTTEANNADVAEQLPAAPAEGQPAAEPPADVAAQPEETAPVADQGTTEQPPETPPAVTKDPEPPLPTKIRLTCPFGYLDDDEQQHYWQANQVVTDPAEIADLVAHGAEHHDISE